MSGEVSELKARLEALEAEIHNLMAQNKINSDQVTVREKEYKGNSLLEFSRSNSKPFSLGIKKLETVIRKESEYSNQI
ncbi:MAG: hypothetical protein MK212_18180 [Saprospiraceae bacterium]|nr:hypothetical protein [Saprospiraceae bacterium]